MNVTKPFPPIDAIQQPVDFLFPVIGDCVYAGYNFPLYAALKGLRFELFTDPEVHIGNISGVEPLRKGLLLLTKHSKLRMRAPHYFASGLVDQCNRPLRVGSHIINLGLPELRPLRPATRLYSEFVAHKSLTFSRGERQPTHAEFLGWLSDKLYRKFEVRAAALVIGKRRLMPMGDYPATKGYAVQVEGITDEQSMRLQCEGIGGRRHMGGGLFVGGQLPRWLQTDPTRFAVEKRRRKRRRCTPLAI